MTSPDGVAQFTARDARELGQEPVADPIVGNLGHALVIGDKPRRVQRGLRDASNFFERDDILRSL